MLCPFNMTDFWNQTPKNTQDLCNYILVYMVTVLSGINPVFRGGGGDAVRITSSDFSSAFNRIWPLLLRDKADRDGSRTAGGTKQP